jgi:hypothetical protein
MTPLDLVKLPRLMEFTAGRPDIRVGLIDGPVAVSHSALAGDNIRDLPGEARGACSQASIWSQFPSASETQIRSAFIHAHAQARTNVTPPLLNSWTAYQALLSIHSRS